ncbi:MAG: isoprenyl transferase [bacterium]|nr:isoprenyl transferase [bacterium]
MIETKTQEEIREIVKKTGLSHIAVIMDGNRRWAKEKGLPSALGHKKGVESLKKIVKISDKFGIKYLTMYAFSTENWNRKKEEVDFLMNLLATTLKSELKELHSNNVKMNFIGNLEALNKNLQEVLNEAVETTKNNTGVNLIVAINYGARDEIVHAVNRILKSGLKEVDEKTFEKFLYTSSVPNPDLLIRTGGELRVSNYLLWQIAYSEIYVTKKYWPEFDEEALVLAIKSFQERQRRYGK